MGINHLNMFHDDCVRIQKIAKEAGYGISLKEACVIWESYSEDYCAGWVGLGTNADVENVIYGYMTISRRICPHCGQSLDKSNER